MSRARRTAGRAANNGEAAPDEDRRSKTGGNQRGGDRPDMASDLARQPFDPLMLADRLVRGGFTPQQANTLAFALAEALSEEIATNAYIRAGLRDLELRVLVRLGAVFAAGIGGLIIALFVE